MASAVMHLCIAKKVNEVLKRFPRDLYLGAIAPDISKEISQDRTISHFGRLPDLQKFLDKYPNFYNNDFELGYYIHLYSDLVWEKYFKKSIYESKVKFLNGDYLLIDNEDIAFLLYNDYTNLNSELIDHYLLDLDIFFESVSIPETSIDEIPIESLQILVDKMGIILTKSKTKKDYVFDLITVTNYIDDCSKEIIADIKNRLANS